MEPLHTMKVVARRTGLSAHAIRIWEKRYAAVKPARTEGNRRLYSESDVQRLELLRRATQAGHGIGQIAHASHKELERLVASAGVASGAKKNRADEVTATAKRLTEAAIDAILDFDAVTLGEVLSRGAVELGSPGVLHRLIVPLADTIGEQWRNGEMKIAHEHLATGVLKTFLASFGRPYALTDSAPKIIVATPAGQLHELGAIIVAAAASSHGWRAIYLGPSLPAEEIAGAAESISARAIALSIVFPADDVFLVQEFGKLRKLLPKDCAVLAGGRSASAYARSLRGIEATLLLSLEELYPELDKLATLPD